MSQAYPPRVASWTRLLLVALALGVVALALHAPDARAAAIAVTTTVDELNNDGDCSLREAIVAANEDRAVDGCAAGTGSDTIRLPAGSYVLSLAGTEEDVARTGDLDITEDLAIVGDGRDTTTIDAADIDRVLHLSAGALQLALLTIKSGYSGSTLGTGIYVTPSGSLTIARSRITDNNGNSGAIYFGSNDGGLTITDSRIDNNGGAGSAGIVVGAQASATIINSVISDNAALNSGGGIANYGVLFLVNSTVSGNSATRNGGGIYNSASPALPGSGTSHLYNVTIANNTADSTDDGAGEGGGIFVEDGAVTLANSIIANNADNSTTGDQHPDCSGTLSSEGHNLIENTGGCVIAGSALGNITGAAPGLGPLQSQGGATFAHALLLTSPAIDAGDPQGCVDQNGARLTIDQRGFARPVDGDGDGRPRCDMGVFEAKSPGAPTPTNTATATPTHTHTPTPTRTSTRTRTATTTSTPANALTATAQASITPSATQSAEGTVGPAPEASPTITAPSEEGYRIFLPSVSN